MSPLRRFARCWQVYADMPFVVRFFWDPVRALDLVDQFERPDHGKILPTLLLLLVVGCKIFGIAFTTPELIVLAALCGGVSLIRALFKSGILRGTFAMAESAANVVTRTIESKTEQKVSQTQVVEDKQDVHQDVHVDAHVDEQIVRYERDDALGYQPTP